MLIPWRYATHIGFNPNLKEVRSLIRRMVELAVRYPRACAHALHIPWRNAFHIAHIVLVRQLALQYITDDLHITMPVGTKPRARRNTVFIDHPQITPPHELRVVITSKRKTMKRLQPAMVGVAAIEGFANGDHVV